MIERLRGRIRTTQAIVALGAAWVLVKTVRLSIWRESLGRSIDPAEPWPVRRPVEAGLADASRIARHVERAAAWLPFAGKCLPRAVACQWLLQALGIPSRLVIAHHRNDRSGEHAFHAWVEHNGAFVTGECDRADYEPVMAFVQGDASLPPPGRQARP
ncbi:lasso peptide biosynthesis B2 protein [Tsuneonella mangrovi]|uniref:lasso peptide biosynthesis B2 protein n=1 Tax=Tsuneonella mangrovi TaxID=1982042 RepID=UPI000BA2416E|nr:lasso peptide biosynthesis B2 protein [Tsuneonella mangrovi]